VSLLTEQRRADYRFVIWPPATEVRWRSMANVVGRWLFVSVRPKAVDRLSRFRPLMRRDASL